MPRTASTSRRLRTLALGLALFLLLGTTLGSCALLDLLTGLYTGTYIEYSACPLVSGGGCDIYDVIEDTEQWEDCHACTIDTVFPSSPDAAASSKQARTAQTQALYWTENGDRVLRSMTGTSAEEIADFAHYPMGLTLDGTHVYWTDWRARGVRRANLDGSNVQDLVTGRQGLSGLAIDAAAQMLYWGDPNNGRIQRLDLNGGAPMDLVTGQDGPTDLALDGAGKIYWIDNSLTGGSIRRANLDGSMVEDVLTGLTSPFGLTIDAGAGKLYWTDMLDGTIRRANLDGTGQEDVLTGLSDPGGVAVDPVGGKVYWVATTTINVQRADLDGTDVETLTFGRPTADLAIDAAGGYLYGTGWVSRTLWRSGLDGSALQLLVYPQRISGDLALDVTRQKVYWGVSSTGIIQRANLDGTNVEDVTGVQFGLGALAFDPVGDKLYWTASGSVLRADPDGSNVETILTNIVFIGDIEIDPAGGRIYWVNRESIQHSNLNGTGIQTFYTDTNLVEHLALHNGILYWSVPFPDVIRRAALDGSTGVEDVVTGVNFVQQIDITGDKLYWSLPLERKIQRSNLDGTVIEDVITGVVEATGLVTEDAALLPVELTRFDATADGRDVLLRWQTASETNNAGFEIQRISKNVGETGRSPQEWQATAFVDGHGTTLEGQHYEYRMAALPPGRYRFRLKQIDFDGTFEYSPEVEAAVELATAFLLTPAYPNPFNPQTRFALSVRETQHVTVTIYDLLGRAVARLHDGTLAAHQVHTFTLDAEGWASGPYLCEVAGARFHTVQTVILSK